MGDVIARTEEIRTNFYTFEGVVKALNGVSLVVNEGETYGLVGESGCGKSVSVRSMMRIVQTPGRIEDGKIFLFFNEKDRSQGIDILQRSEAYMESIRGNDISMIFQEASSSLNPVLSIGFQVGESFLLHRQEEMIREAVREIDEGPGRGGAIARRLLDRELRSLERYNKRIAEIDRELFELEDREDATSAARHRSLIASRDRQLKEDILVKIQKRIPILRRYRRRINKVVRRHVIDLLTSLGIPNPTNIVDRYPHELSGGMQQRIVIAIALACHPKMLIADEPTSNLDVTIQAQILELIKTLKETKISSVLFITHDLGVVAEVCDRVTVMYAGDACETAPVRELFQNPYHPYTKGLLESVPKVRQEGELQTIPGMVPNLIAPPSGCRFHPRCPHVMEICRERKPETITKGDGHTVACHLYEGTAS